jgi:integrase
MDRATIRQKKTGRPVRFELTDQARMAIDEFLRLTSRKPGQFLFAGRGDKGGLRSGIMHGLCRSGWQASATIQQFRHAFVATNKGRADPPANGEFVSGPAPTGAFEDRQTVCYLGIEVDDGIEIAKKIDT